ncbi:MAG: hypothetical protein K9W44_17040 [Candidatus Lokiarchaeota archaeon]|nr:hypothetical protein [Candidatus Harpocratesius repetitus]
METSFGNYRPFGSQEWLNWREISKEERKSVLDAVKSGIIYNAPKIRNMELKDIYNYLKKKAEKIKFNKPISMNSPLEPIYQTFSQIHIFYSIVRNDKSSKIKLRKAC